MLSIFNIIQLNGEYMQQKSLIVKKSIPLSVEKALKQVGENIRIARKRRSWTIEEMASKMFVSRQTLAKLENGDPSTGLTVLTSALWVLGLDGELADLGSPEKDKVGIFFERKKQPKRVRKNNKLKKPDF